MRNRTGIVLLTLIVTLLCAYYLSLTFITGRVEDRASLFAIDSGRVDHQRQQYYLDSVWNEPVFHFLGMSFTYKELKETELSLGLDLQGGMHVVLEVAPSELIRALSRDAKDPILNKALSVAKSRARLGDDFLESFYSSYSSLSGGKPLTSLFAHVNTRDRIAPRSTDEEVLDVLQSEIDQAVCTLFLHSSCTYR